MAAIEKSSTDQSKQVTIRELEIAGKHVRDTQGRKDFTMTLFHTDNQERLKLRIKEHLLALTDKSMSNPKKLLYRRHIGQDLIDLRDTYDKSDAVSVSWNSVGPHPQGYQTIALPIC